jgi:hypothetical protein
MMNLLLFSSTAAVAISSVVSVSSAFVVNSPLKVNVKCNTSFPCTQNNIKLRQANTITLYTENTDNNDKGTDNNSKVEQRQKGYQFGDISRAIGKKLSRNEDYKFGDLTKKVVRSTTGNEDYEFGNLSRWVDSQIKDKVNSYTNQEEYNFGDITKEFARRLRSGEFTWEEMLTLLKIMVSFGMGISPVAQLIPSKLLIELLNVSILQDVGERVTSSLSMELDRRIKKAVVGNADYQFGDITKSAINKFTGKGEYEFGDITRAVMEQQRQQDEQGQGKSSKRNLLGSTSKQPGSTWSDNGVVDVGLVLELEDLDKVSGLDIDANAPKK